MKANKEKRKFIELRAEGLSFDRISKQLGISPSTCMLWDDRFKDAISKLKNAQLNELYEAYYMTKEARIKQLGKTLERINSELDARAFDDVATDKLLDHKAKYIEALKKEYIPLDARGLLLKEDCNNDDIRAAMINVLERLQNGQISKEQARQENDILRSISETLDAEGKSDAAKLWMEAILSLDE